MDAHVTCECCEKVEYAVTDRREVELLPGIYRAEFVYRCPACDYHRPEQAYESEVAEGRYRAVEELVHFFKSDEEAEKWLAGPVAALGGEIPGALLDSVEGVARVRAVVDSLARTAWEANERWNAQAKARFDEWVAKWAVGSGAGDKAPGNSIRPRWRPDLAAANSEPLYSGCAGWVGPGWLPLLDRLAADLIALGWNRELEQVKEKFGGLQFYVGAATAAMMTRIRWAQVESLRTCERCGEPGTTKPTATGWFKTECDACRVAWTPTAARSGVVPTFAGR